MQAKSMEPVKTSKAGKFGKILLRLSLYFLVILFWKSIFSQ